MHAIFSYVLFRRAAAFDPAHAHLNGWNRKGTGHTPAGRLTLRSALRRPPSPRRNIVGYIALARIDAASHKLVAKDVPALKAGPRYALVLELMQARAAND